MELIVVSVVAAAWNHMDWSSVPIKGVDKLFSKLAEELAVKNWPEALERSNVKSQLDSWLLSVPSLSLSLSMLLLIPSVSKSPAQLLTGILSDKTISQLDMTPANW